MKSKIIQIQGISFKNEEISYTAPMWEEMGKYCFLLAQKVIKSDKKFDRLVTMAKGGWTWSRTMSDYLNIDKVGSIQVQMYRDYVQKKRRPVLLQALPVSVKDERVLIFDDVSDTGETLAFTRKYLKMSGAKKTTVATLFFKPWSQVKPDFYMCQTKAWVIFPHEVRESIQNIGGPWLKKGISKKEVLSRFVKIGLPQDQVEYFLKSC